MSDPTLTADCPRHPACGCAPASPDPCVCPPLTPHHRAEAARLRDEVESLRRAVATFDRALGIVVAALPDDPWLGRDGTCYACGGSRPLHPAPCAWVEAYHVRRGR